MIVARCYYKKVRYVQKRNQLCLVMQVDYWHKTLHDTTASHQSVVGAEEIVQKCMAGMQIHCFHSNHI